MDLNDEVSSIRFAAGLELAATAAARLVLVDKPSAAVYRCAEETIDERAIDGRE